MRFRIKNFLMPFFIAGCLFSQPAIAKERKVNHNQEKYIVEVDNKVKFYEILRENYEPPVERIREDEEQILAKYLLEELADKTKEQNEKLNEKISEFIWQNPSRMNVSFQSEDLTLPYNAKTFSPFDIPQLDINIWKEGKDIKLKFGTNSQSNLLNWYKDCSVIFIYPENTQIVRRIGDKMLELDLEHKTNFGYKIKEVSFSQEREVCSMLFDAVERKLLKRVEKEFPEIQPFTLAFKFEEWLAKQEKKAREEAIAGLKDEMNFFEYAPQYKLNSRYEVGRILDLAVMKGQPGKFYVFINTNISLNPLIIKGTERSGTMEKIGGPLIELIAIEPGKVGNKTPAGEFVKRAVDLSKKVSDALNKKRDISSLDKIDKEYDLIASYKIYAAEHISFLDSVMDKKIKSLQIPEYAKYRNSINKARQKFSIKKDVTYILDNFDYFTPEPGN